MSRTQCIAVAAALLAIALGSSLHAQPFDPGPDYVPDEIIVQFNTDADEPQLADAIDRGSLTVKKHLPARGKRRGESGLVVFETRRSVAETLAALEGHPAVQYAEPNSIKRHQAASNDPNYLSGKLWGIYGDQTSPANPYGSQAGEAWAAGNIGSGDAYVAVIDTGIDIRHPDLAPNIGRNPGETGLDSHGSDKATNGIDDDGNGYVDDVYGYDFINNDNTVFDGGKEKDEHGTHVAGTIGAAGGNGIGVAGVCWNVKLLSGKFLGAKGGTVDDEVEAIEYFIDLKERHGLNIVAINASYGGGRSLSEQVAIIRAAKAGILVSAAAGNYGGPYAHYPSSYDTTQQAVTSDGVRLEDGADYDAVIAVAAIDSNGALPSWSNWGSSRVDLGAPGDRILSTLPGGRYGTMYGTSMATPHVTGACALYLSAFPGALPSEIKSAVLASTIYTPSLLDKTFTDGRLDVSGFHAP